MTAPPVPPERIETCERCQMKLPEHLGTHTPGIRGGMAWRCAVCLPIEGPSGRLLRDKVVQLRKLRLAPAEPMTPVPPRAAPVSEAQRKVLERVLAHAEALLPDATPIAYSAQRANRVAAALSALLTRLAALEAVVRDSAPRYLINGGCSNCGGVPHSSTCMVGQLVALVPVAPPAPPEMLEG